MLLDLFFYANKKLFYEKNIAMLEIIRAGKIDRCNQRVKTEEIQPTNKRIITRIHIIRVLVVEIRDKEYGEHQCQKSEYHRTIESGRE